MTRKRRQGQEGAEGADGANSEQSWGGRGSAKGSEEKVNIDGARLVKRKGPERERRTVYVGEGWQWNALGR